MLILPPQTPKINTFKKTYFHKRPMYDIIFFMKKSGLTETKMKNQKFRKTENAIFIAYYKFRDYPTVKALAKRAGIARSTLYRHHKSPRQIPDNYEKYLLEIYSHKMKRFLNQENASLKKLYFRKLIFIHNNQIIFEALFRDGRKEIIKDMIDKIKTPILSEWNYKNPEKLYKVYQNEVLGIIENWHENNFNAKEIGNILNDILYLNKTTPKHLARFLEAS